MDWNLEEALDYYRKEGAPQDQTVLINLLTEIQEENGGTISMEMVGKTAQSYGIKETFLLALIKRIPRLRLQDRHCLEICCGPNCSKRGKLADWVQKEYGEKPAQFELKYGNCMRLCGKGPNIKWDGQIYHGADEKLVKSLIDGIGK